MTKIVSVIFLGVAVLLLSIAGVWTSLTRDMLAKEKSATGIVVDMVERYGPVLNDDDSFISTREVPYYYPVVEFYTPEEKLHHVQLATGSWPPAYEIGQEVTVLYDPEQPLQARIQSSSSAFDLWFGPAILFSLGAIFLSIALALIWAQNRRS